MSSDPVRRRDAGLRRISTITKGTVAGGLVLTGAASALAAHSFSGTSAAATKTQSTTAATTPSTYSDDDDTYSYRNSQLQSPSYSIRSSSGSGRVSSGGS